MYDYNNLVNYFKEPVTDYYDQLLVHADVILAQARITKQWQMAQDLGITQPKLSTVLHMLSAYSRLLHNQIKTTLNELERVPQCESL